MMTALYHFHKAESASIMFITFIAPSHNRTQNDLRQYM